MRLIACVFVATAASAYPAFRPVAKTRDPANVAVCATKESGVRAVGPLRRPLRGFAWIAPLLLPGLHPGL